ncbi:MAG: DUF5618 family protein [Bacteroidota bacterium]|nr:DUF5618 family protein [Bacteroidota bacterium]
MSLEEQIAIRNNYYTEAKRYLANAYKTLKLAGKEDGYYVDVKYVKSACGIAYLGVLLALDGLFKLAGLPKPKKNARIEYYTENLAKYDKKLLNALNDVYALLHLEGYYRGLRSQKALSAAFEQAEIIINRLK